MLLSHMLHLEGIDSIVIERQSREHVMQRIRAGVLEDGTVKLLRDVGLAERLDREANPHHGVHIAWQDRDYFLIDTKKFTGRTMAAYGQTAITEDLYRVREANGAHIVDGARDVEIHDLNTARPTVTFEKGGKQTTVSCDFVAGCDGFHGVSRNSIPSDVLRTFERTYPFGCSAFCRKPHRFQILSMRSTPADLHWRRSERRC